MDVKSSGTSVAFRRLIGSIFGLDPPHDLFFAGFCGLVLHCTMHELFLRLGRLA